MISTLDVTDKVKEKLVDLGYDPKMGARPLRRTIQDYIEDAITDYYLENPSEKDLKAVMTSNGEDLYQRKEQTCERSRKSNWIIAIHREIPSSYQESLLFHLLLLFMSIYVIMIKK